MQPQQLHTFQRQADWGLHLFVSGCSGFSEEALFSSSGSVDREKLRNANTVLPHIYINKLLFGNVNLVDLPLPRSLYQHLTDPSAETSCPPWSGSPPPRLCATKMIWKHFDLEPKRLWITSSGCSDSGRWSYLVVWGEHFSLQLLTHVIRRLQGSFETIVLS